MAEIRSALELDAEVRGRGDLRESISVLFCIDVEPDERFIRPSRPVPWRGYESSLEMFSRFRTRASAISGDPAHFTWVYRMDPQVTLGYGSPSWVVTHYMRETSGLADRGDDLGLHTHAYRWSDEQRGWSLPFEDQRWLDECLITSAEAFEKSFGRRCRTFRLGDRWMSQATMNLLQQLGARYDLTLEPGVPSSTVWHRGKRIAVLPDYSGVPEGPYRPSKADYRTGDPLRDKGLVFIPMTTAAVRPRRLRDLYDLVRNGGRRSKRWTALLSHDPVLFRRIITDTLERRKASYLALPVRSGALAERRFARRVAENLDWMLSHPLRERFRWSTPGETLQRWDARRQSSPMLSDPM